MSSSSTTQWQDSGELNDIKERKKGSTEFARAVSPASAHKKINATNAQDPQQGRTSPLLPRTTPQHPTTRSRANHNDRNNPSGKSFVGKMELLDTLLNEIDQNDPRNVVTMLPSQVKKMAAKNQPLPILAPGSPLKRSPSGNTPERSLSPTLRALSPPQLALDHAPPSPHPLPSQSPDRKQPAPPRPRNPAGTDQAAFARAAHIPDAEQSAREQSLRDQPARDQPPRDQPARDKSTFLGKDSPDQVRPSARQNSLAGGSRAMLAQSRIPNSLPPPPPVLLSPTTPLNTLPPPPALPLQPPELLPAPPDEVCSPRMRPGYVAVLPMPPPIADFSLSEGRHLSPQKLPPPPPIPSELDLPTDKKLARRSPYLTPPLLLDVTGGPDSVEQSLFRNLPLPPPPSQPTAPSSNLTGVYSTLPPPPPLPTGDAQQNVRRSKDFELDENTPLEEGFKAAKGRTLGKASQILLSNTRQLSSSNELPHSHSSPNLLLHDPLTSPMSAPSVLSPLSHSGSMYTPPQSPTSSTPTPPPPLNSSTDSEPTYEQRMRKKLIAEIVTTEVDYVKDLELTIDVYLHPLRASKLLTEDQIHTIFSDFEILLNFNKILKAELEKQHSMSDIGAMKIGSAFLTMSPFLKLYSAYCSNQPIAFKALEDYKKAHPNFTRFLSDTAYDPRCKGLFLSSYLIKPVQRVCKYPLFLRDLLKYTPKDHADYPGLVEAESMINSVVQSINEYKRALESYHAVVELANIMEGIDDLVQPTRKFVAEGDLMTCYDLQGVQKPRRLHLFNDILLICKKRETRQLLHHSKRVGWKVKDRVDLSAARLISLAVECVDYALEISCQNQEKFILVFPNDVQWNKWSKLLKDQIIQNRVASHTRRELVKIAGEKSVTNLRAAKS